MQLSVSLSSFFPPGFPGKPPPHNSCHDQNQNSRQASYGKCGDYHWLFRLAPLLHTWCLLPGSVGGTRIVFAMVPLLSSSPFYDTLGVKENNSRTLEKKAILEQRFFSYFTQATNPIPGVSSPPTSPGQISNVDHMVLPGQVHQLDVGVSLRYPLGIHFIWPSHRITIRFWERKLLHLSASGLLPRTPSNQFSSFSSSLSRFLSNIL